MIIRARGVLWTLVVFAAALAIAYAVGSTRTSRADRADVKRHARQDAIQHDAEQLRRTAAVLDTQHRVTAAAVQQSAVLRARHATARAALAIVSDSQVRVLTRDSSGTIDSTQTPVVVPTAVVREIHTADSTITQDSVTMRAQAAELQTLYRRDSTHTEREQLLEHENTDLHQQLDATKPPRCGRGCGFVAGATATASVAIAVAHPVIVKHLILWVVRLVH